MERRLFAQMAVGAALSGQAARRYKAAVIGHTGRGNYGHDWDRAFTGFASIEVVAVADPEERGRLRAKARSGALRDYADYRTMLEKEKPDLVAIGPRWPEQHEAMLAAAAGNGAHIVMEKPFARNLEEADRMVAIAEKHGVKVQVGHTARPHPVVRQVKDLLREGRIGQLMEMRARGKEDRRAGGEDLMVLGTHCFDLMRYFAGDPAWVFAHVTNKGREATRGSARQGSEPLGPVAGDGIAALFAFAGGVHGYFGSQASDVATGVRFGVTLYGSRGVLHVPLGAVPNEPAQILRTSTWAMEAAAGAWERLEPPPEGRNRARESANAMMVADLLEAIEKNREPVCSARDGRWAIEMVQGVYASQLRGARVEFPLRERKHPLGQLNG